MITLDVSRARRLALANAGLWPSESHASPHDVIQRFGYLQLDTVSISGARSHGIVLHSRLDGYNPSNAENLLRPGEPLFEYWGHEVSWMPLALYPVLAFRRRQFAVHPWWGNVLAENKAMVKNIKKQLRTEGPLRTMDLEGKRATRGGWWNVKLASRVAMAMWSAGLLAIRQRTNFHRAWDLPENVIPDVWRKHKPLTLAQALPVLLESALGSHGWATTGTLARTWRLSNLQAEVKTALQTLVDRRVVMPCQLQDASRARSAGWVLARDLERVDRLSSSLADPERAVLLSPFDPLLWDRARVARLFGFEHTLEIYKPAAQRTHGYFVLPVLAGESLVARVDLKAEPGHKLRVLSCHLEPRRKGAKRAAQSALRRYAASLERVLVF